MRSVLTICGIVLCLAEALAAGGGGGAPLSGQNSADTMKLQVGSRPSAAMVQQLRRGLTRTTRRSLGGTITRTQQLQMLMSNAVASNRLRDLQAGTAAHVTDNSAWSTGITLTPFSPIYPPEVTDESFRLRLMSDAIWFWPPYAMLPDATQNPPLLKLRQNNPELPFLTIEARWPQPGAYMITFFMRDFWDNSPWSPRVKVDSAWYTPIVPNQATGADRWTILCDATDPAKQEQVISLTPHENFFGFSATYLSKVVITRLQ